MSGFAHLLVTYDLADIVTAVALVVGAIVIVGNMVFFSMRVARRRLPKA